MRKAKWRIERCEVGSEWLWRAAEAGRYGVVSPWFETRAEAAEWARTN